MNERPDMLLAPDEPAPVTVRNENGSSPFLIVADHAGNSMPRALGRLGVLDTECERHIAWTSESARSLTIENPGRRRPRGLGDKRTTRNWIEEMG